MMIKFRITKEKEIVIMNRYHSKAGQLQVVNSISSPMFHLITSVQLKKAKIELRRDIILALKV